MSIHSLLHYASLALQVNRLINLYMNYIYPPFALYCGWNQYMKKKLVTGELQNHGQNSVN